MAITQAMTRGWSDLLDGVKAWRVTHVLGIGPLRQRYARSALGQFWIVLSTAITIAAFGLVWSLLWNVPVERYLPYIALSYIVWGFINTNVMEAVGVFPAQGRYFLTHEAPLSVAIYAVVYRNFVFLLHSAPVIAIALIIFPSPLGWDALLAIPGLAIVLLNSVMIAYVVALICARFRDVGQLVGNGMQILFFTTPVMWQAERLSPEFHWIVDFNPFAGMLSIVRDPLLGRAVTEASWMMAGLTALVGLFVVSLVVGLNRRRVVFWI